MKLDKRQLALVVACSVFSSSAAWADTFDLDCVIKGKPALGIIDTNAVEQRVFGEKIETISVNDERVIIDFKREQVIVNRNDKTVFVDGEVMDDATCEVKNFQVVAASAEQLSAQASNSVSSSALGELQQGLAVLEEELLLLREENAEMRDSMDDILDVIEYLADKNVSAGERVLEKIENITD